MLKVHYQPLFHFDYPQIGWIYQCMISSKSLKKMLNEIGSRWDPFTIPPKMSSSLTSLIKENLWVYSWLYIGGIQPWRYIRMIYDILKHTNIQALNWIYWIRISAYLFIFKYLYWSIIALQWYVSFCFITKWISYTYTYVPISLPCCVSLPPTLPIPPL